MPSKRELAMAMLDRHKASDTNRRALIFCLTWVGFFAAIGAVHYLVSVF